MKKYCLILLIILGILPFFVNHSIKAQNAVCIFANGGYFGVVDALSAGIEVDFLFQSSEPEPKFLFGFGFSAAFNRELDYNGSGNDLSEEFEIYGSVGVKIVKSFILTFTGGGSLQQDISYSPLFQSKSYENVNQHFAYSAQIRYVHKHLMYGVGYHNRRGLLIGIGYCGF